MDRAVEMIGLGEGPVSNEVPVDVTPGSLDVVQFRAYFGSRSICHLGRAAKAPAKPTSKETILFSPAGPIGNHLQYVYGSSEPIAGFQLAPFFTGLSMSRKAQV